ncbi:uncharacterized protein EI97DRAFT_501075 [Westerdykella ornata]|uniref:Uncharacterized protein n=1 Tax=Westerdykella ornata TaxID=318751 RepID=A0A6A6JKU4_WESOR|nr:uncharacterized protein EI97DRAFT_501075 [Westerdykella ornata]KAF2276884.1 hypothetical protein EI97DRAFT_501075 [Westerdykella ornata]
MRFSRIITSALCLFSVQALTVPEGKSLNTRTVPGELFNHAKEAIRKHAVGATRTMMHSGIGAPRAYQIAKSKGLQTVETTMALAVSKEREKYKDTLVKFCVPKEQYCRGSESKLAEWKEAWGEISRAWAEYAEQRTTLATHKGGPATESFYKKIEEPILQRNGVSITIENNHPKGPD